MKEKEKIPEIIKEMLELNEKIISLLDDLKPDPNITIYSLGCLLVSCSCAFKIDKKQILKILEIHWDNYKTIDEDK